MNHFSRNYGIDMLRILSMIGVIFLHVLGHGGILSLAQTPAKFLISWFLEIVAFPAVNCFVLISGYVGYKGEKIFPKIKSIVLLMFTVLFYSITIFLAFRLFGVVNPGTIETLKNFMPTFFGQYWFFTAYFGLFLISPLLNIFVNKSSLKQVFVFFLAFVLFCIVSLIYDAFSMLEGYSVIWFAFMYLIGAIIKKYDLDKLFSKKVWFLIFLSAFLITWLSKVILNFTSIPFLQGYSGILVTYVSPTMVLMAIGLLCLFANQKCFSSFPRIVSFFSSSAFSVYLIHDNLYVRANIISKMRNIVSEFSVVPFALIIILIVITVFVSCILIDKVRMGLFRIIKVDKIADWIETFVKTKVNTLHQKLKSRLETTEG